MARNGVLVLMDGRKPWRAHQTENVRFIEEQFSTVIAAVLEGLKSELHAPKLNVAHCRPCLGRPSLWRLHSSLDSSALKSEPSSSFYLPPASRSPQLFIGRHQTNDG
jgi:hypothetical protein